MSNAIGGEHQHTFFEDAFIARSDILTGVGQPVQHGERPGRGNARSCHQLARASTARKPCARDGILPSWSVSPSAHRRASAGRARTGPRRRGDTVPQQALRSTSLTRDDELALRVLLAEAWLLQDDLARPAPRWGARPTPFRESSLRHRCPISGGCTDVSPGKRRSVARHRAASARALKQSSGTRPARHRPRAFRARALLQDSVGDSAIMGEHFGEAASALHAVGDNRTLALVHSLNGSALAQRDATTKR